MPRTDACPRCGRSGAGKSNLTARRDIETQRVYLTELGYFFRNPYWHNKMVPEPSFYEELVGSDLRVKSKEQWEAEHEQSKADNPSDQSKWKPAYQPGDIHKAVEPSQKGSLSVFTTTYWTLYQFKYRWIYTDRIIVWLPYGGREWIRQASFFLKPVNEDCFEPAVWLQGALETRFTKASYVRNQETGAWEYKADSYKNKDLEKPNDEEKQFLESTAKQVYEWINEYEFKPEAMRNIYNEPYLNKTKEFLKEYRDKGKWAKYSWSIPYYTELRLLTLVEGEKLVKHIEGRLDKTRKGYEFYLPISRALGFGFKSIERINDERLIIHLKRDFVADWYPLLFDLEGTWKFSERPLTKKQIEEWNEATTPDGKVIKFPLQSCVFCPPERGMSPDRSDDCPFFSENLIDGSQTDPDAHQTIRKQWQETINRQDRLANAEEVTTEITEFANNQPEVRGARRETIESALQEVKELKDLEGLDSSIRNELEANERVFQSELGRRDAENEQHEADKNTANQRQKEHEEDRVRIENEINRHTQHQQQINQRLETNEQARQQLTRDFDQVKQNINNTEQNIRNQQDTIRNANLKIDRAREEVNDAVRHHQETEIMAAKGRLRQAEDDLRTAERDLNRHQGELANHRATLDNIRKKLDDLDATDAELRSNYNSLAGIITGLRAEIVGLEAKVKANEDWRKKLDDDERQRPDPFIPFTFPTITPTEPSRPQGTWMALRIRTGSDSRHYYFVTRYEGIMGGWSRMGFLRASGTNQWKTDDLIIRSIEYAREVLRDLNNGNIWMTNWSGVSSSNASNAGDWAVRRIKEAIQKYESGETVKGDNYGDPDYFVY
jgi:hypothetical protein